MNIWGNVFIASDIYWSKIVKGIKTLRKVQINAQWIYMCSWLHPGGKWAISQWQTREFERGSVTICVGGFFSSLNLIVQDSGWRDCIIRGSLLALEAPHIGSASIFGGLRVNIQGNSIGFKFPGYFTRIWNRVVINDDAVSSKIWRNNI